MILFCVFVLKIEIAKNNSKPLMRILGCIVLILLVSNLAYGQVGGVFPSTGSQVFQVGDIVRYGKSNELARQNTLNFYLSRERIIRYLGTDSTLLNYRQLPIHSSTSINNRGETTSISLPLLERTFGATWDRTKALELVIESGHQYMFIGGESSFNDVIRRLPVERLQAMHRSGDRFMFITHTYYVSSGRLVERRGQTIEIAVDSASIDFSRPLSTDSIIFVGDIPSAYNMMSINRNKLCRLIREQGGHCLRRWEAFVPLGIKQFNNDQNLLGSVFLVSQTVAPIGLAWYFNNRANDYYDKHRNLQAHTLTEHRNYYAEYKHNHYLSIWAPVGLITVSYIANILVNRFHTSVRTQPRTESLEVQSKIFTDETGSVGVGLSVSFNF